MSREIKFRGKCQISGDLVFGDLIHGVGAKSKNVYILPNRINLAVIKHCDPLDGVKVDPETVGQYTGVKDKNGVDIYEGDIVKIDFTHASWWWYIDPKPTGRDGYSSSTGICQVDYFGRAVKIKFPQKDFWFDRYPDLEDKINIHYLNTYILFKDKCEVIGNIYENPELLQP